MCTPTSWRRLQSRPQLLDPYGRNLTPRALVPAQSGEAPLHAARGAFGSQAGGGFGSRPATSEAPDFPAAEAGPSDGMGAGVE